MLASRPFGPYLAHLDLVFVDLEPVWGHLGPSWAHLGAILGDPGPILGPSWASVAPILGHLGAMLGPCWAVSALAGRLLDQRFAIFKPSSTLSDHSGRIWGLLGTLLGLLGPNLGLPMSLRL